MTTRATPLAELAPGLGAIFLVVFLDILGFSLVLPFLADEARTSFGTTEAVGALLSSVYSLMQFLFIPVWGRVSDRVGRRPVLLWSVFASALGMGSLGLALLFGQGVFWLFLARAASGVATANIGTASAYVADSTSPQDRGRGMGVVVTAISLGYVVGPAIGGSLASIRIDGRIGAVPCFVAAGLSFVNFVWALWRLRESLPPDRRSTKKRSMLPLDMAAARDAFARPGVALAVLVNFIVMSSFASLDQTFRFFSRDRFGMSSLETGLCFTAMGAVGAFVPTVLMRVLLRRFADTALMRAGTIFQTLAYVGIVVSPNVGKNALFASCGLLTLGTSFTQPTVMSFLSRRADPREQGSTQGTNQAASSMGRMLGPALGGWVYGTLGSRSPFVASAIGMAVASVVAIILSQSPKGPA